jgi:hypothetical protein
MVIDLEVCLSNANSVSPPDFVLAILDVALVLGPAPVFTPGRRQGVHSRRCCLSRNESDARTRRSEGYDANTLHCATMASRACRGAERSHAICRGHFHPARTDLSSDLISMSAELP